MRTVKKAQVGAALKKAISSTGRMKSVGKGLVGKSDYVAPRWNRTTGYDTPAPRKKITRAESREPLKSKLKKDDAQFEKELEWAVKLLNREKFMEAYKRTQGKQRSGGKIKPKVSNVSKRIGSAKTSIGNMRFAKKKK